MNSRVELFLEKLRTFTGDAFDECMLYYCSDPSLDACPLCGRGSALAPAPALEELYRTRIFHADGSRCLPGPVNAAERMLTRGEDWAAFTHLERTESLLDSDVSEHTIRLAQQSLVDMLELNRTGAAPAFRDAMLEASSRLEKFLAEASLPGESFFLDRISWDAVVTVFDASFDEFREACLPHLHAENRGAFFELCSEELTYSRSLSSFMEALSARISSSKLHFGQETLLGAVSGWFSELYAEFRSDESCGVFSAEGPFYHTPLLSEALARYGKVWPDGKMTALLPGPVCAWVMVSNMDVCRVEDVPPQDVLETAVKLWDPQSSGLYSDFNEAFQAAWKL